MVDDRPQLLFRALKRARRITRRVSERVRGLSLRSSERNMGRPVPPGNLIYSIANSEDVAWFVESGELAARGIRELLSKNNVSIDKFHDILDFGCGVGRVIRQWDRMDGPRLHGVDYNPALIAWCQAKLPFAHFQLNQLDQRLNSAANTFDFIYCLSVFTHLSEHLQNHWMEELFRVLTPGGYLLITTHGDSYLPLLSPTEYEEYKSGHVVVQRAKREGSNDCAAFHPESYVRNHLAQTFDVLEMVPEGALGNPRQDVYLMRKPSNC